MTIIFTLPPTGQQKSNASFKISTHLLVDDAKLGYTKNNKEIRRKTGARIYFVRRTISHPKISP